MQHQNITLIIVVVLYVVVITGICIMAMANYIQFLVVDMNGVACMPFITMWNVPGESGVPTSWVSLHKLEIVFC